MHSILQTDCGFLTRFVKAKFSWLVPRKSYDCFYNLQNAFHALLLLIALFFLPTQSLLAQPAIQWDKTYGGIRADNLSSIRQTADGGFIAIGLSQSGKSGDKSQAGFEGADLWIVKTAADGTKQWDLTLASEGNESDAVIELTPDGGYIVGTTSSSGIGPVKSQPAYGTDPEEMYDYWIIKLSANGTVEWDKTIGGPQNDFLKSLKPTKDGGYILGGISRSQIGNDKTKAPYVIYYGQQYAYDHWIVKLSSSGAVQWDIVLRRQNSENTINNFGTKIELTADGGYIVGGYQDTEQSSAGDYYLAKLSQNGAVQWEKTYGGPAYDQLECVLQANDGGYLLGGWSSSNTGNDKSEDSYDVPNFWVIKVDANGNKLWDNTLGAGSLDNGSGFISQLYSIAKTSDGGFLLGGISRGNIDRDKSEPSRGVSDFWVVKIDADGTKRWDKTIGGSDYDTLRSIAVTSDGGIIMGGVSSS